MAADISAVPLRSAYQRDLRTSSDELEANAWLGIVIATRTHGAVNLGRWMILRRFVMGDLQSST